MAQHKVVMSTPKRMLRKKDVEFTIRVDGELMGTLMVSRGGLDYRPAHAQRPFTRRWRDVHEFFYREKWKKTGVADELDESDVD